MQGSNGEGAMSLSFDKVSVLGFSVVCVLLLTVLMAKSCESQSTEKRLIDCANNLYEATNQTKTCVARLEEVALAGEQVRQKHADNIKTVMQEYHKTLNERPEIDQKLRDSVPLEWGDVLLPEEVKRLCESSN
jgi:hypothetical protein